MNIEVEYMKYAVCVAIYLYTMDNDIHLIDVKLITRAILH